MQSLLNPSHAPCLQAKRYCACLASPQPRGSHTRALMTQLAAWAIERDVLNAVLELPIR